MTAVKSTARFPSISYGGEAAFFVSAAGADHASLRILGAHGKDVNDAIDRIGDPHGSAWSADHFYPVDILQRQVLHIPVHARKQRSIYAAAVNHHQHLVREPS